MIRKFDDYSEMCIYFYEEFKLLTDNKLFIPKSFYKKQQKILIKMYDFNLHNIVKDDLPTFWDWFCGLFKRKKKKSAVTVVKDTDKLFLASQKSTEPEAPCPLTTEKAKKSLNSKE